MKKIFEKPTLKKILLVLAVLFIIILAPITMPLMFIGGCFGIWRFTKRKPNIQKRNIAIAVTIVGILGIYAVGKLTPDVIKEQTEQSQVTKFTSNSSSTSSSSSQTSSSTASSSKKEKQEKERKEKELKEAQKQKQEEEKKAREEQARKEAETKKIVEEANQAVVGLEINASHLRPVKQGYVCAKSSPIRLGKNVQVWQIDIRDAQDKLCCVSRLTLSIITHD